jgi:hypothetical protein
MLGQGVLSDVEAQIQSEVGVFLQLKSKLQEMVRSPVLTISDKAQQLLTTQNQLETELQPALEGVQSGSMGLSDILSAGGFFYSMEKQISDVNDLYNEYSGLGSSAKASLISGVPDWLVYVAGFGILLVITKKSRR